MKNKILSIVIMAAFILGMTACQTPEDLVPSVSHSGINSLKAYIPEDDSEDNVFQGEIDYTNHIITIVCPYNYPRLSDNLFPKEKLSKMRMEAGLDNNVYVSPSLLYMDLTKENFITVTLQNKEEVTYKVVYEIRKSKECAITKFNIETLDFDGVINEESKQITLLTLDPVGSTLADIAISHGATVSPDPATIKLNYDEQVILTVTAQNGVDKAEYKVKVGKPNKLPRGMRKGSEKLLWSKSLSDMGINGTDNNTTAIATSTDYLFVNTRNSDLKYFNRYTGEYVGTITLPFKGSLTNFAVANDNNNNLLITNLRNAKAGTEAVQTIYRITGTGEPQKYIEISHLYPTGRKISICGNLDGDAIILTTVEISSKVLYWEVKGGILQSQEPKIYTADESVIKWNYVADAVTVGTDLSNGVYCTGYIGAPKAFGYFKSDGSTGTLYNLSKMTIAGEALSSAGHIIQGLDITEFNKAKYIALADQYWTWSTFGLLFDVTSPTNLGNEKPDDPELLMSQAILPTGCNNNANNVADVNLRVSEDGMKMTMYIMGTNGGVAAYVYDCVDVNNIPTE